jgi:uncharacterized surface protein with fasciclin (FAS1) repeats
VPSGGVVAGRRVLTEYSVHSGLRLLLSCIGGLAEGAPVSLLFAAGAEEKPKPAPGHPVRLAVLPKPEARHSTQDKESFMKSLSRFFAGTALAIATSSAFAADIVDTAVSSGQFKTLVKAVQAAGLVDTLKGEGPFTVFAPTDAAFARLPAGALEALLQDKEKLTAVLTYHVVPGKVTAADVRPGQVKTVQGQDLTVTASGGAVRIDNARVVGTDIMASNGVIHVIDTVVLPQ